MRIRSRRRFVFPGWSVLLAASIALLTSVAPAKTTDPVLAEKIYRAIETAQTSDPDSYISTFDYQAPDASRLMMLDDPKLTNESTQSVESCSGLPTHGKVYGSAMLEGEVLDYEIDFYDLVVHAKYKDQQYLLPAKDLVDFQSKEGWPCAVPVAAVICAISGGAFCGWRITQCYRAAERCPCGVAVYNCGVCGEGSGVQCQACQPPRREPPDLYPIFDWPITWGY